MPKSTFTYLKDNLTVVWKPEMCIHSRICWTNLREVFDPAKKPWVNIEGASLEKITDQIKQCPSGALSYMDTNTPTPQPEQANTNFATMEIRPNGPILVKTGCVITHSDGRQETRENTTSLCRCGASEKKPFCDGSHKKIDFKG